MFWEVVSVCWQNLFNELYFGSLHFYNTHNSPLPSRSFVTTVECWEIFLYNRNVRFVVVTWQNTRVTLSLNAGAPSCMLLVERAGTMDPALTSNTRVTRHVLCASEGGGGDFTIKTQNFWSSVLSFERSTPPKKNYQLHEAESFSKSQNLRSANQDIPRLYGTRMFITEFTRAHHLSGSCITWIQSTLQNQFPHLYGYVPRMIFTLQVMQPKLCRHHIPYAFYMPRRLQHPW